MLKVIANLDTATHVIIDGKEYPRYRLDKDTGDPVGSAVVFARPITKLHTKPLSEKRKAAGKGAFSYYFEVGSGMFGKRVGNFNFLCRLSPAQSTASVPDEDGVKACF